ncbi:MAG: hypothetical protein H6708_07035 [Kofleriaceae bacterium]|nr:hypothetical protein [Kofleriaceae bacterium]
MARFDELFPALVAGATHGHRATLADLDAARRAGQSPGPSAAPQACAEVAARVTDTLGADRAPIVAGDVADVAAVGAAPCWVVSLSLGFTTLLVVLDADDGALRLAWLPPEG